MPRIFAWRYDSKLNYILYCAFILGVILIPIKTVMFLNEVASLGNSPAVYKTYNSTGYRVFYRYPSLEDDWTYDYSYCDYYTEPDPVSILNKNTVLLKSDNKPVCPEDIWNYFWKMCFLVFCWLVFVPLGCIVYYDAYQFWKTFQGKSPEKID